MGGRGLEIGVAVVRDGLASPHSAAGNRSGGIPAIMAPWGSSPTMF